MIVAETREWLVTIDGPKIASMGPRLDSRGNVCFVAFLPKHGALQWGRDLIVAETCRFRSDRIGSNRFNGAAT